MPKQCLVEKRTTPYFPGTTSSSASDIERQKQIEAGRQMMRQEKAQNTPSRKRPPEAIWIDTLMGYLSTHDLRKALNKTAVKFKVDVEAIQKAFRQHATPAQKQAVLNKTPSENI